MSARSVAGAMALLLALPGLATAAPPGVNLRWDQCFSDGGAQNKAFACDTNVGSDRLVVSLVLDSDMQEVSGNEIVLQVQSASPTLPSWWSFRNAGTCRQTSLIFTAAIQPGAVNCLDWSSGNAAGGIGAYQIGYAGANTAKLVLAVAVPPANVAQLLADQEYFICALTINHAKTVGTGACSGCDQPVCLAIEELRVTTPVIDNDRRLAGGASAPNSEFARWQNGLETNVSLLCHPSGCSHEFTCVDAATPTRNSTWGALKALYR